MDLLWDAFPVYMAFGMSSSEYWNENPYLAVSYREAHKLKDKIKNNDAWWQGLYVYKAVETVHYNLNKKKGAAEQHYPDKPFDLEAEPEKPEDQKQKVIEQLNTLKANFDAKQRQMAEVKGTT